MIEGPPFGSPRWGKLMGKEGEVPQGIPMPCLALPTFRGSPRYLFLQELDEILGKDSFVITVPLHEILLRASDSKENPSHDFPPSSPCPSLCFSWLKNYFIIVTFHDACSTKTSVVGGESQLFLLTKKGRHPFHEDEVVEALLKYRPHLVVCPGEEVPIDDGCSIKRQRRSVVQSNTLTQLFLKALEHRLGALSISRGTTKNGVLPCSISDPPYRILLNCQGGSSSPWRIKAAQPEFLEKNTFQHIRIVGAYIGGMLHQNDLPRCLSCLDHSVQTMTETFKSPTLTFTSVAGTPQEIILAVWCGINIVEVSCLPFIAAEKGFAFCFETEMPNIDTDISRPISLDTVNLLFSKDSNPGLSLIPVLDLKSRETFSHDTTLLPYSHCVHESKAFIHHLLNCNEMMGSILLTKHNINLLGKLMHQLRLQLQQSKEALAQYILWFIETQCLPHPERDQITSTSRVSKAQIFDAPFMIGYTARQNI